MARRRPRPEPQPVPIRGDRLAHTLDTRSNHNPELTVREAIIELVKAGMRPESAAVAAGISLPTWHRYQVRGWNELDRQARATPGTPDAEPIESERRYAELMHEVMVAEAALEGRVIAAWQAGFKRDWRAAQAFAKARFPKSWGGEPQVQVVQQTAVVPSVHDLSVLADALERRAAG